MGKKGASFNPAAVSVDVATIVAIVAIVEIAVEAEVNLKRKDTEQVC